MTVAESLRGALGRWRVVSLLVGLAAGAVCVLGAWNWPEQFYPAYLVGYIFWLGVALGCQAIAMLHHLTGGAWGSVIRRPMEAAYSTLPLLAVAFLPIAYGSPVLYRWANADLVAADPSLQAKAHYLNIELFYLRALAYFAVWIVTGLVLNRISAGTDPAEEPRRQRRLALVSGPGLVLWSLTVTFASVDWVMSLEPQWYSSAYGALYMGGFAVSGMAVAILTICWLRNSLPWSESLTADHLNDLANLLLAFMVFWSYVAFMQYLIIWSGNLPEETFWYVNRGTGGWQAVALALIFLHFALPFLVLLSRAAKRAPQRLAKLALLLLVMRLVEAFWLVQPAFLPRAFAIHWLQVVTPLALGGLWLALYAWRLPARASLPVYEIPEFIADHGSAPSTR